MKQPKLKPTYQIHLLEGGQLTPNRTFAARATAETWAKRNAKGSTVYYLQHYPPSMGELDCWYTFTTVNGRAFPTLIGHAPPFPIKQ